jgi:hypothetical protein
VTAPNPTDAPFLRPVRDGDGDQAAKPARLRTHWTADELRQRRSAAPKQASQEGAKEAS